MLTILEPVLLRGEGKYNLNAVNEIKVTESYLGLEQNIIGCQNEESLVSCTTRKHIDTFLQQCGCLPFNLWTNKEECILSPKVHPLISFLYFSMLHASMNKKIVFSMQQLIPQCASKVAMV